MPLCRRKDARFASRDCEKHKHTHIQRTMGRRKDNTRDKGRLRKSEARCFFENWSSQSQVSRSLCILRLRPVKWKVVPLRSIFKRCRQQGYNHYANRASRSLSWVDRVFIFDRILQLRPSLYINLYSMSVLVISMVSVFIFFLSFMLSWTSSSSLIPIIITLRLVSVVYPLLWV